jgi:hypothetical protein
MYYFSFLFLLAIPENNEIGKSLYLKFNMSKSALPGYYLTFLFRTILTKLKTYFLSLFAYSKIKHNDTICIIITQLF